MPREFEPGIPALYKYQSIKYFPFKAEPGASYVLTSDPFSYLKTWFRQQAGTRQSPKKSRMDKGRYFVDLAEGFAVAAENARLPTKATLVYYSLLNLVKAYLCANEIELETKPEVHGITLPSHEEEKLTIAARTQNHISIFKEFSKSLGTPVTGKMEISFTDFMEDIPEIHELVFSLGLIGKRKFLPVEIDFLTNEKMNKLFTEIKYQKRQEPRVSIERFDKGERKEYFKCRDTNEGGYVIYRSATRVNYTQDNLPTKYKNICKKFRKFDLVSILTRSGYRHYINLKPGPFHHLANHLAFMFYLGTIARYRPSKAEELMTGQYRPIISECIATSPKQFQYQIASLITKSVCAVPMAKL